MQTTIDTLYKVIQGGRRNARVAGRPIRSAAIVEGDRVRCFLDNDEYIDLPNHPVGKTRALYLEKRLVTLPFTPEQFRIEKRNNPGFANAYLYDY